MEPDVVDVVIPVYNEEAALPAFLEQLQTLGLPIRPIFIDNGSTDNSLACLKSIQDAVIISHKTNVGYGGALRAGIEVASSEKIVIIDADGEYSPEAIPHIVEKLDRYGVVHTSRFIEETTTEMNRLRFVGNTIITSIFNLLFHQRLTDLYTGCKGYRKECIQSLKLARNGFEHVLEVSAKLARAGIQFQEVPVTYCERQSGKSKMNHLTETAKYLILVIYYFFSLQKTGDK